MSTLKVEVCEVKEIKEHPNADLLQIARVKGWDTVVKKGEYKIGDSVVFIPPDALIPSEVAEKLNIKNYLAGKQQNRVKQIKLRGEMSYGLIIPNENNWDIGTDVSDYYGITKYEPPARTGIEDAAPNDPYFIRMSDIENIKNEPDIFKEDQVVAITEKIDGTRSQIGISKFDIIVDEDGCISEECFSVSKEEIYSIDEENEEYAKWKASSNKVNRKIPNSFEECKNSLYWYPYTLPSVYNLITSLVTKEGHKEVTLFGEVYGSIISGGHKSLNYGVLNDKSYAAFRLRIDGKFISYKDFKKICEDFNVPIVPLIDIVPYNYEKVSEYAKGNSILASANNKEHMREGVVVVDYENPDGNIIKILNPDYLLLKEKGKIKDYSDV